MSIDAKLLEDKINELLDVFYAKRYASLNNLKLLAPLKRKNPYLYRAIGVADANTIVEEILRAHVSSSDETIFGNDFFEPLAKWVAVQFYSQSQARVSVSDGEGVDITIDATNFISPIAVKSGVNVFNASSKKKQGENFATLSRRLQKVRKHFDPIVGYCYGRKQQSAKATVNFRELAGQEFWEFLTGESDFYLRVVRLMEAKPIEHRVEFLEAFGNAKNRFTREFLELFSDPNTGAIDWDKLLAFNSGKDKFKF